LHDCYFCGDSGCHDHCFFIPKINLLRPVVIAYVGGISAIIGLLVVYLVQLSKDELDDFSKVLSNGLILFIFLAIVLGAVYKKINVFDAFIEGAKEGFTTCVKIIPIWLEC
jgi:SNF family Na+-dependent transporter